MADEGKQAGGDAWGDDISEEQQAKLKVLAGKQHELVGKPLAERLAHSHFRGVYLSGADVFWLAAYAQATVHAELHQRMSVSIPAELRHLASTPPDWREYFAEAQRRLRRNPHDASDDPDGPLVLHTDMVHLEGASLERAHLEAAHLHKAHLEEANLCWAHLEGADLAGAHLEGARLSFAHLEGASFVETHLGNASLQKVHLEGANLAGTYCEKANLAGACFDRDTYLAATQLNGAWLGHVTFDDTDLSLIDWSSITTLGEEVFARKSKDLVTGKPIESVIRLGAYQGAVRVNRLLAVALRAQGMNEEADRFAYRAQMLQRHVLWSQRKWVPALGSWLLWAIAGYGYRPRRSVATYALVVGLFAAGYFVMRDSVHPALNPLDAIIFSVTSFHGRGFMPGENVTLHNPLTIIAGIEAILGLLIEITFIATFTQRFFAR